MGCSICCASLCEWFHRSMGALKLIELFRKKRSSLHVNFKRKIIQNRTEILEQYHVSQEGRMTGMNYSKFLVLFVRGIKTII